MKLFANKELIRRENEQEQAQFGQDNMKKVEKVETFAVSKGRDQCNVVILRYLPCDNQDSLI